MYHKDIKWEKSSTFSHAVSVRLNQEDKPYYRHTDAFFFSVPFWTLNERSGSGRFSSQCTSMAGETAAHMHKNTIFIYRFSSFFKLAFVALSLLRNLIDVFHTK